MNCLTSFLHYRSQVMESGRSLIALTGLELGMSFLSKQRLKMAQLLAWVGELWRYFVLWHILLLNIVNSTGLRQGARQKRTTQRPEYIYWRAPVSHCFDSVYFLYYGVCVADPASSFLLLINNPLQACRQGENNFHTFVFILFLITSLATVFFDRPYQLRFSNSYSRNNFQGTVLSLRFFYLLIKVNCVWANHPPI